MCNEEIGMFRKSFRLCLFCRKLSDYFALEIEKCGIMIENIELKNLKEMKMALL